MLSDIATARAYYVRVRYNTNLRASYSLDIAVIARSPSPASRLPRDLGYT